MRENEATKADRLAEIKRKRARIALPLANHADADWLIAEVERLRDENRELHISIEGGCGCPAPYDTCPHDEPLLPALNRARVELRALRRAAVVENQGREQ